MTSDSRNTNHKRRSVRLEVEALEARDLPSTSPLLLAVEATNSAAIHGFNIVGTGITMSQQGLPSSLSGNVYYGPSPLGQLVGGYQETLTPLLLDGMFIGSMGEATFTFGLASGQTMEIVRTLDISLIQGYIPTSGALLVKSNGAIIESAGLVPNVEGGFTSASAITLGSQFALTTHVDFQAKLAGFPNS